jgi:asparagine synthase (glutamine-hydrolysing)
MCGICGIFNLRFDPLAEPSPLDAMMATIYHRGPDSDGKFELPYLAIGMRRLSIIDLATGDQPLSNESGDVTLVFNGEIYNFRELRAQLVDRGHRFKTHSDGEVIAHLYEERGTDCVRELNGMFAIALWDERARRLLLARDRAGEKPLFYWARAGRLIFGSEIRSLLVNPEISRKLDPAALAQYFLYGYFPSPRSVFSEIRKLPAGHVLVAENGQINVSSYWRLQDYLFAPGSSRPGFHREPELLDELRARMRDAVGSRLVSDVPIGAFLSGGIDSSAAVAIMSELTPGNVNTFSVAFPQQEFNEEPFATQVARQFKTHHHVLTADDTSLREALTTLSPHLDEPLADPAILPTFLISRFARQHIKVALSGEGGDELFGGYPTYAAAKLADYYLRVPRFLRRNLFETAAALLPKSPSAVPKGQFIQKFVTHADRDPAERHEIWFGAFLPTEVDQLFSPGWFGEESPATQLLPPLRRVLDGARFENVPAEMLYLDFRLYLEDDLLVKVDRASMACSLEVRAPYLDHRLIEFAAGLPLRLKVRGFELKYLMKKAARKWLPPNIVRRQKRGFSVPIAAWLRNELRPLLERTLAPAKLERDGIFDVRYVRRLIDQHASGASDYRKQLWSLLCFQLWHDHWIGRVDADPDRG